MTGSIRLFSGRHALVTGGGSGIGAAVARSLLEAGARVTIAGRRRAVLEQAAGDIGLAALDCFGMDVTDARSVTSGVAAAVARHGRVDILINNAGRATSAPFGKATVGMLDDMLTANVRGTWLVTEAVLPGMIGQKWGRIVNVASTAGLVGYAYATAYVAAKHAVVGLTRALALEVARQGVTVNAVCPGFTETPLLDGAVANITAKTGRSDAEARSDLARGNPLGRLVQPQEVADAVLWLASPGAAAINGQAVAVCGGEVMTG
ncbi:MAG TPA: SDR family NAD(P)-dependent oxidoreductase [Hyphomicrobiaceae bacterium]|nr:SDR family NAD(P)-dependent oxidoreductase [Hyphomicrobiaceae bacterium]